MLACLLARSLACLLDYFFWFALLACFDLLSWLTCEARAVALLACLLGRFALLALLALLMLLGLLALLGLLDLLGLPVGLLILFGFLDLLGLLDLLCWLV